MIFTGSESFQKRLHNMRILVVDDSRQSRMLASQVLRTIGVNNIFFADDGEQALEMSLLHHPDLVLLDLLMPKMNGYQYCRAIRQKEAFAGMPIIVQTGVSDAPQLWEALENGASDFVTKPIQPSELKARMKNHLERLALARELEQYYQRLNIELSALRELQYAALPTRDELSCIEDNYGLECAVHFQPSTEISGDFWGFEELSSQHLGIYLVDFSGHGLTAAMNTFRLHTLMQTKYCPEGGPGEYLQRLNASLHGLLPTRHFACMFYGIIDLRNNQLHYSAAASTDPFILYADGNMERLDGQNFPLSVRKNQEYQSFTVPFAVGDMLFCYSDALVEKYAVEHPGIGYAVIEQSLSKQAQKEQYTAHSTVDDILREFFHEENVHALQDDLTIISIKRKA
jgi:sigma-B regulation protein RsbU (phosphoserine phosphatase)